MPLVIAHRGASLHAPENSLTAFRLAIDEGAGGIETDARLSRDGEIVLLHDSRLERTTNCHGHAGEWTAFELAARGVPSLEQLLVLLAEVAPDVLVNVELKERETVEPLVTLLRRVPPPNPLIVSAFDWGALDLLRAETRDVPTACLVGLGTPLDDAVEAATSRGHSAVHPDHRLLGTDPRPAVERAQHQGLRVNTWTVNDVERMRVLTRAGVDGIMTDDPALLRATLRER